jgi:hypothetical protein
MRGASTREEKAPSGAAPNNAAEKPQQPFGLRRMALGGIAPTLFQA